MTFRELGNTRRAARSPRRHGLLPMLLLGLGLAVVAASCDPGGPPDPVVASVSPGDLLETVVYSAKVCVGQPIRVKVTPDAAADEPVDVYVQGRPGTNQWMQFDGEPGTREVQVYAHTPSGKSQFITLSIELKACDTTWPQLHVALDTEHDRMVDFVVANAHEEFGDGVLYRWTFGDGSEVDSDVPAVRHTYAIDSIDWHAPDTAFQATVQVVGDSAVARHTVVLRPMHAFNEARGVIQLPVEYDITAHTGDYVIHNVEASTVSLTRERFDLQPCDRSLDVTHLPSPSVDITIDGGASYSGHIGPWPMPRTTCAVSSYTSRASARVTVRV